ncbi:MAG TPA: class I tRNA ligase family protein [Candidatus Paceibacterota bacterium]
MTEKDMGMPEKLTKPYNPKETEGRIYDLWEKSGYFNPDNLPAFDGTAGRFTKPFSVVLPPPNVTGTLHLGHALEDSLQDAIVRYKRMRGYKTLWVPGTDHAAIATQSKVEKILEKEGRSRHDLGRGEFLKRVEKFARESHGTIVGQIKRMGASLDWSREAFTLDEGRSEAVKEAFKLMREAGLIYQGNRIVNWDPKGQTVISDDEIIYKEEVSPFYYMQYGPFVIGTVRPETKFGDKYVVINPNDPRYNDYKHGQKIDLEWINGPITATVIHDPEQNMEFGSGAMTITPWHDAHDFELAEKFGLEKEQVIDEFSKLLPIAGEFAGMKIAEARVKIIEKLKEKGLLVKIDEKYVHNVPTAERTGGLIEPQIKLQWFVAVNKPIEDRGGKTLKDLMREPVESGAIKIIPEHEEKKYFNWINNLRDWCISRQIWYGHKVPVEGESDTLDTWFSSALWSFSTLGWPERTKDMETYHPNSLINPGYEILFFWLARMVMMSQFLLGKVPFRTAYLHGILRDKQGRKFSKSLGNGVDPIEIIDKYGADALRMSLIVGIAPGMDSDFDEQKVMAYKKFANKLWNISRYVISKQEAVAPLQAERSQNNLITKLNELVKDVTLDMDNYKFYLAAEKIYQFTWHEFADKFIEESKDKDDPNTLYTLRFTLCALLRLLHPFMPFVTEEIWGIMHPSEQADGKLLMIEPWPII